MVGMTDFPPPSYEEVITRDRNKTIQANIKQGFEQNRPQDEVIDLGIKETQPRPNKPCFKSRILIVIILLLFLIPGVLAIGIYTLKQNTTHEKVDILADVMEKVSSHGTSIKETFERISSERTDKDKVILIKLRNHIRGPLLERGKHSLHTLN